MLLLRPIIGHAVWLSELGDELRRLHILRVPIKIENFLLRAQKIFGMTMTFQAPGHAMRLGDIHRRHLIDRTMATEATDAAIHVRRVIVINVIDRAMEPNQPDRLS